MKTIWLKFCRAVMYWFGIELIVAEVGRALRKLDDLLTLTDDIRVLKTHILRPVVFVVVSSPVGMMSRRIVLVENDEAHAAFVPQTPIPAGACIIVVGDGYITDVTVGNMAQLISYPVDSGTPVCFTQTAAEVGSRINVRVKSRFSK